MYVYTATSEFTAPIHARLSAVLISSGFLNTQRIDFCILELIRQWGTAKSGSLYRGCCKTASNGQIDLKLSMEGTFGRYILVLVNWRSHGICGGKINILQFWLLLSTRNIFTYPIHDFYEVSVSKKQ